jgi:hypothetical protein
MTTVPWYRHRWPWILMSGPGAVLIAGAATMWIAFASADGLVAEDYYKQGLSINKVIAREEAARSRGIDAKVVLSGHRLTIEMTGEKPDVIFAHLAHATRAGHDLRLRLKASPQGLYEADVPDLPAGHWRIAIEDAQGRWRIAKEVL